MNTKRRAPTATTNSPTSIYFSGSSAHHLGLTLHGALDFVGVNGVPRYQSNPDLNNFSPRFGIAYRVE